MATETITRTDQDIQSDVLDELTWEPRVRPNEIGVTVSEGVVTLTGWVDSYAKKWAAERAAHRVARVRAVANDLAVRIATSAEKSDPEIATAAGRALEWDAFVPIEALDVTVADGWVTLHGQVEWEYQRRAAERAVGRLTGVRGVSNGITVRPAVRPDGRDLAERIVDALARNGATEAEGISVRVHGDTAVLAGLVHSVPEREEIERVVWSAPGIREVHNHVTVGR
ncbi:MULTISPECIES: BON domain-containing protein [Micromonospora]|uniref:BON domain-containing protein n=1 Tax=Micromonospora solifontis TaxID=2487138 RepID=A0ABX9WB05_9ACTN|nr:MULTISPECIES: BON domain-containing protein [Micromonospora]NES13906.1 BON domain-containing protein [Micromonospora sp. PPF5-17B]NES38804.1 BON domain-containing protein [Micromonospora solifontis]NES54006.1 BON domain-containing protein [Micromonospora sp. PPF5-6]RNL93069.1 BON domain-containing protein [Micromonospora solifontis]